MQEKTARRTNKVRREEMKGRLMAAARQLFVEKGFSETGTPEIVKSAGATRGALYHHFADKTDLFRAVVIAEAQDVAGDIAKNSEDGSDAASALKQGVKAFFRSMEKPGRVRLLLMDGPSILGQAEMASIDAQTGGNTLKTGLSALMPVSDVPLDALADIISASFDRAAIAIANGSEAAPRFEAIMLLLERLTEK